MVFVLFLLFKSFSTYDLFFFFLSCLLSTFLCALGKKSSQPLNSPFPILVYFLSSIFVPYSYISLAKKLRLIPILYSVPFAAMFLTQASFLLHSDRQSCYWPFFSLRHFFFLLSCFVLAFSPISTSTSFLLQG